jgi:hypothetical protein
MAPQKPLESFMSLFHEHSPAEEFLRTAVTVGILGYVLIIWERFRSHLSYPIGRTLRNAMVASSCCVLLVVIGTWWCPRVGLALAVAVYFYLNDMHILTSPFVNKESA